MFKRSLRKSLVFRFLSLAIIQIFIFTSYSFAYPAWENLPEEDLRVSAVKSNPLVLENLEGKLSAYPSDSLYLSQIPKEQIDGKTFIIRVDYNVPTDKKGNITDDSRIAASVKTINFIRERGGKVVLMSHLGRPKGIDESLRLNNIAARLEKLSGFPVKKFNDIVNDEIRDYVKNKMKNGEIILLENVRFSPGDEAGDEVFAQDLASLADVFVLDGFGVSHRGKQATVGGVAKHIPGVKGLLIEEEERGLTPVLKSEGSMVVLLGGAKVSDKVKMIEGLMNRTTKIFIGGGMAVPFIKVMGGSVGASSVSEDDLKIAERIYTGKDSGKLLLPVDVLIVDRFSTDPEEMKNATYKTVPVGPTSVPDGWYIVDIGPQTVLNFRNVMNEIKPGTILWNGNMGVSELKPAAAGTRGVAELIAYFTVSQGANSIICGGNTAEAVKEFGLKDKMSFVSTGGGAAIEFIENNGTLSGFTNLAKAASLKDFSNLAKKKGDVPHRSVWRESVNGAIETALAANRTSDFTVSARENIKTYLARPNVREKLAGLVNVDELNKTLDKMKFTLVTNPSQVTSPAIIIRDNNYYQIAHVGLTRQTGYFPEALIRNRDFYANNQELLNALLVRELVLLNKATEVYAQTKDYSRAVNEAEDIAEKAEKLLVGDSLDQYAQNQVDRFLSGAAVISYAQSDLDKMTEVQRRPIIGGNWKMSITSADEARELLVGIAGEVRDIGTVDIVVCPSTIHLKDVVTVLKQLENAGEIPVGRIHVAAQNMWAEEKGAFTSGISAPQLTEIYVDYVLLGHSEVRRSPGQKLTGESNQNINRKLKTALKYNLTPIVCVGESLEEREAGKTNELLSSMVRESLADIEAKQASKIVIAYEPVWAIGTGKTATPEQANEAISFIRGVLADMFGIEVASQMRLQYGGSVKADNIANLIAQSHIDGALVGGDSLKAEKFAPIVKRTADYVINRETEMWAEVFPAVRANLNADKINEFKDNNNPRAVVVNYQLLRDNPGIGLAIMNANTQLGKNKSLKFVLAYDRPGQENSFYKNIKGATNGAVDLAGQFDLVVSTKDSARTVIDKIKSRFENLEKVELIGPQAWAQVYQSVPGIKDCIVVVCEIGEGGNINQGDLALWAGLNALVNEGILTAEEKHGLFSLKDSARNTFKVESKKVGADTERMIKVYREVVSSE